MISNSTSSILSVANSYSSLITAIATVVLAIVTWLYVRELRNERKFGLRKEHTQNLKEKVVKPWLEELNRIGNAKKGHSPLPDKLTGIAHFTYEGENLNVEKCLLFNDLRNHVDSVLFQTYEERFKKNCRELLKENKNLEKKMELYLKDKFEFLPWDEFYNSEKKLENGFFEKDFTLPFFLDSLLSGSKCIVKINETLEERTKKSEKIYGLCFYCSLDPIPFIGKYQSKDGRYIDREITEEKRIEIKNTLERLLEEAKDKFKNDVSAIHRLVEEINNDKRKVQGELERLKEKSVFSGECEFI
ncbi:MAG: hypothetical protein O8C63_09770 [Candidatus Methanoperedens sp.]|nr:hypothetical protein [Candidatus Methanoperedens sp.]